VGGGGGGGGAGGDGVQGEPVTLGLVAAAKLRVLTGRADASLFHRVPDRARIAASMAAAR
jgi:hypothetical protein